MSPTSVSAASNSQSRSIPTLGCAGAASKTKRIASQAAFETKALMRNGEQLMVSVLMPLGLLFVLGQTSLIDFETGGATRLDFVVPGVMAMAIMASAFTSQAISTGFDRRNGVLRFLATTPLGKSGLLGAKIGAVLAVAVIQLVLIAGVSLVLGWNVSASGLVLALVPALLGAAAFTSLALLIAGTLRAEGVIALANIILVALVVGGGVLAPASQLPAWLAPIATYLPSGALGDAFRSALIDSQFAALPLTILAGWTILLAGAAARLFKWH